MEETVLLYIIPAGIQKQRLQSIKTYVKKNGYKITETFNNHVTHILTELETEELAIKQIPNYKHSANIVSIKWFYESVKSGKLSAIDKYTLKRKFTETVCDTNHKTAKKTFYLCQKPTPLNHYNSKLVMNLETLAKRAELRDDSGDYSRALAFRKAITALKQMKEINFSHEVDNINDIGEHSRRIIIEVLEKGFSEETKEIENSEWFKSMIVLTSIYGVGPLVGPTVARKWYGMELRSIKDILQNPNVWRNNLRLCYGLAFYEDLKMPVTLEEGEDIKKIIQHFLPNYLVEITGGFRRGKTKGHDLDLLITSEILGNDKGILEDLFSKLKTHGFILHGGIEKHRNSFSSNTSKIIDNFDKCFTIMKYCKKFSETFLCCSGQSDSGEINFKDIEVLAASERIWKAKRVDLVVCPLSQWAYALLGWTGNKMYNRSLRDYTHRELNMRLTSHGLYDIIKKESLPANNERDIFSHLKLNYLEPWERNA